MFLLSIQIVGVLITPTLLVVEQEQIIIDIEKITKIKTNFFIAIILKELITDYH